MRRIQKTISEFIGETPPAAPIVATSDTVSKAVEVMRAHKTNYVVVLDGERLEGIFTERDFLNRVTAARRTPAETVMADVMTSEPQTLSSSDCVSYAINQMAVGGFRNIPIVDADGKFRMVLTVHDVVGHLSELLSEVVAPPEPEMQEWIDIGGG